VDVLPRERRLGYVGVEEQEVVDLRVVVGLVMQPEPAWQRHLENDPVPVGLVAGDAVPLALDRLLVRQVAVAFCIDVEQVPVLHEPDPLLLLPDQEQRVTGLAGVFRLLADGPIDRVGIGVQHECQGEEKAGWHGRPSGEWSWRQSYRPRRPGASFVLTGWHVIPTITVSGAVHVGPPVLSQERP
jgi:hypothetical protein